MAKTDTDPQALFMNWMRLATRREPSDAQAAAFATIGADGMADVRMVLVRRVDDRGVIFFTNRLSRKAKQLALEPSGALCFHWKSLGRQVRMRGHVELVSDEESDHYFARRARASQLGAHASKQSHLLASREDLTRAFDKFKKKFSGAPVPRPDFWGGYRLVPIEIEFWTGRASRLHDRLLFSRASPRGQWRQKKLFP